MKKNDITYEYRVFTNRLIDVDSMEVGKCTSKVIKDIKPKDKVDGRFFHTSDTDEWYFCWKGELQKLNLKGDSDVSAALDEVKKLIDDANAAVSDVKATAKEAQQAAVEAKAAADAAGEAIETIENKADKSYVDDSVANKADVSVVNTLSQKISEKADASDVKDLSDKVNAINLTDYATKTDIKGLASESFVTSQGYAKKSEIPSLEEYLTKSEAESTYAKIGSGSFDGVDLDNYATKEFVSEEIKKIEFPKIPDEYVTESELSIKGYLTEQDISEYAKQEWVEQQGYLTEETLANSTVISGIQSQIDEINNLLGKAEEWTDTILNA